MATEYENLYTTNLKDNSSCIIEDQPNGDASLLVFTIQAGVY